MNYCEAKPTSVAADLVKLYWEVSYGKVDLVDEAEPILPDGCVEIIFDFRDRFQTFLDSGEKVIQPRSIVAGQFTSRILIGPTGDTELFGIRLRPEAGFTLLGLSMEELRDQLVDLKDVIGAKEEILFDRLSAAKDFRSRREIFEEFLPSIVIHPINVQLSVCINSIRSTNGATTVRQHAASLGWSERRLERAFKQHVGLSPKLFSRITRFQSFLIGDGFNDDLLLDRALAAGFYDQAHLIKDFRSFAGVTPTEYFASQNALSELFITT